MKTNLDYLGKPHKLSGPWRDWSWLLLGFFVLIILLVAGNLALNSYIKTTISYSLQNGQAIAPTINQKALTKTLETMASRAVEYQEISNKPKIFSDPSL